MEVLTVTGVNSVRCSLIDAHADKHCTDPDTEIAYS